MRFNMRKLFNPTRVLKGVAWQAAGVVVEACNNRYVSNTWANWAVALVAAGFGVWYPITQKLLKVTHLDEQINNV